MVVKDELKNCFTVERVLTLFKTGKIQKIVYWVFTPTFGMGVGVWGLMGPLADSIRTGCYGSFRLSCLHTYNYWSLEGRCCSCNSYSTVSDTKEWAYAGVIFLFTGAAASHFAVGDSVGEWTASLIGTSITLVCWILRPATRRVTAR